MSKDLDNNSKSIIKLNEQIDEKNISEYNIYELNDLEYSEALKKDKRNFFEYYLSILKEKHILFFSFCKNEKYNSRIIKIFLFFYSFVIYFFVNTLFFTDSTMHKIYIDAGSYNFIFQISQILYSLLVSALLNIFIRTLALTENNIKEVINNKTNINKMKKKLIKLLFYKLMIFFIITFIYYYSFCIINNAFM